MTGPVAQLGDVCFGYRRSELVVRGFSARFDPARVYAVTGPSGCGKSTILSMVGLLLRPLSGTVSVAGHDCATMTERQRSRLRRTHIGFVFQDSLLETSMTVWENLTESLPPNTDLPAARNTAHAELERLELPPNILSRRALALSGGQSQRIALLRALLKGPTLVLADEPTGNLDDSTGRLVLDTLLTYGRQPGHACIIVTHDDRVVDEVDDVIRVRAVD